MSDIITPGTIACEDGTLAGAIYDAFAGLVDPSVLAQVETAFKRIAFAVSSGTVSGIVAAVTDGYVIGREGANLVGTEAGGGGGGGAPTDATYIVATSNGTLTAERVATATTTVTVDTSTAGQIKFNVPDASTAAKGVVELATSAETTAGLAVQASDSRLSDARTPTSHAASHASDGSDPIPAATESVRGTVELATSIETTAGLAVQASDTRLSDARTPTAHAASHQNGGSDEVNVAGLSGLLADPQTPASHGSTHASDGADPIPQATTTVRGTVELATDGENAANVVVQGNDGRLSDSRTPTAHASTHQNGGADEISVTGLSGLLADGQTPLAHAASHNDGGTDELNVGALGGFSGVITEFLNGAGTFTVPGAGGAPVDAQYLVAAVNGTLTAERATVNTATVTWDYASAGQAKANVPSATTSAEGVVELATDGETTSNRVVQADDGRVRGYGQSVHSVRGSSSQGSTYTRVFRWTSEVDTLGSPDITYTSLSSTGSYWTINNDGIYTVSYSIRVGAASAVGIMVRSSLSNVFNQADLVQVSPGDGSGELTSGSWTGRIPSGWLTWVMSTTTTSPDNSTPNYVRCAVTRVR